MPGSIVSGIFGKKAAKAQESAADKASDTQLEMFERSVELSEPWRATGGDALSALSHELGLAELPTFGESTSFNVGDSSFDTRDEAEKFRDSLLGGTSQASTGGLVWNDKETLWEVDRNAPPPSNKS